MSDSDPESYKPPPHLITSSRLTAEQLISQFNAFKESLRFASTTPELVFERVVTSLNSVYTIGPELEPPQHLTPCRMCNGQLEFLRSSIERFTVEVRELKGQNTTNVNQSTVSGLNQALAEVPPANSFSMPPARPVKFTFFGTGGGTGVRASVIDNTYELRDHYSDDCTWLDTKGNRARERTSGPSDFEYGSYNTLQNHPPGTLKVRNEKIVNFASPFNPFSTPPKVLVWLTGFDMSHEKPWNLKVFATDITTIGFNLHIDTCGDSVLYSAGVSWVACPCDSSWTGSFTVVGYSGWGDLQFKGAGFRKLPRIIAYYWNVLLAVNEVAIVNGSDMNLELFPSMHPGRWSWDMTGTGREGGIYRFGVCSLTF